MDRKFPDQTSEFFSTEWKKIEYAGKNTKSLIICLFGGSEVYVDVLYGPGIISSCGRRLGALLSWFLTSCSQYRHVEFLVDLLVEWAKNKLLFGMERRK